MFEYPNCESSFKENILDAPMGVAGLKGEGGKELASLHWKYHFPESGIFEFPECKGLFKVNTTASASMRITDQEIEGDRELVLRIMFSEWWIFEFPDYEGLLKWMGHSPERKHFGLQILRFFCCCFFWGGGEEESIFSMYFTFTYYQDKIHISIWLTFRCNNI